MKNLLIGLALIAISAGGALAQDHGGRGGHDRGGYGHGGYSGGGFRGGGGGYHGGGFAPPPASGRGEYGSRGYTGPRGGYEAFPGPGGGGFRGFTRGQFMPQGYAGGAVVDPRQYHLRRPPNGYGWVTVGPNAYLTQRSTGLILDTAPLY